MAFEETSKETKLAYAIVNMIGHGDPTLGWDVRMHLLTITPPPRMKGSTTISRLGPDWQQQIDQILLFTKTCKKWKATTGSAWHTLPQKRQVLPNAKVFLSMRPEIKWVVCFRGLNIRKICSTTTCDAQAIKSNDGSHLGVVAITQQNPSTWRSR